MRVASLAIVAALALFPSASLSAAEAQAQMDAKPFAEHHLALQLSDSDARKQALVLSIAYNMLKVYGPDRVAVEVVTFGPGIDLLRADNANRQRVDSLVAQGVKFDVCGNTLDTIARETGHRPEINPHAVEVEAGVAQLLKLAESNYTVIRP